MSLNVFDTNELKEKLDPADYPPGSKLLFYRFGKQNTYEVEVVRYSLNTEWVKFKVICSFPPEGPTVDTEIWMDNKNITVIERIN